MHYNKMGAHTRSGQPMVDRFRDGVPPKFCPRCQNLLSIRYDECYCRYCGYRDYGYMPNEEREERTRLEMFRLMKG